MKIGMQLGKILNKNEWNFNSNQKYLTNLLYSQTFQ